MVYEKKKNGNIENSIMAKEVLMWECVWCAVFFFWLLRNASWMKSINFKCLTTAISVDCWRELRQCITLVRRKKKGSNALCVGNQAAPNHRSKNHVWSMKTAHNSHPMKSKMPQNLACRWQQRCIKIGCMQQPPWMNRNEKLLFFHLRRWKKKKIVENNAVNTCATEWLTIQNVLRGFFFDEA